MDKLRLFFSQGSQLINALKNNDFIVLTGPSGSGKSTLIRLVERTINKQMSTTHVSHKQQTSIEHKINRFFCFVFQVNSTNEEEQRLVIVKKVYPNAYDEDEVETLFLFVH